MFKIKPKSNPEAREARPDPACAPSGQTLLSRLLPRRMERALRRHRVRQVIGLMVIVLSVTGSLYVLGGTEVIGDRLTRAWEAGRQAAYDRTGMRLARVLVAGRKQVSGAELAEQSGLEIGAPLFEIDAEEVRARIMAITWVREAEIRVLWPDSVRIDITERSPVAVWQLEGDFALIDAEGVALGPAEWPRDDVLPRLVGEGANLRVGEVLRLLDDQPEIGPLIEAVVRVRDRRWNLRLWNGVDILLPEQNPGRVLAEFVAWELDNRILERDIKIVDLRLPDRWYARLTQGGAALMRTPGKDT